jgi:antirestriction protein
MSDMVELLHSQTSLDKEVCQAYIELVGEEYVNPDDLSESYVGKYNDDVEFTQELLEQTGDLPELPFYIHIDWEGTARDIMMDYSEVNGHYFRNI